MQSYFPEDVVVSKDGKIAVRLIEFEGVHRIPNRDAKGAFFTVQLPDSHDDSRVGVIFSGTTENIGWETYNFPPIPDADRSKIYFAAAAIGEHLDEQGLPPYTPSGTNAAQIECFSQRFQEWNERTAASDEEIQRYIEAKLYWSWRFETGPTVFGHPDLLRLRVSLKTLERVAQLGEGLLWVRQEAPADMLVLSPTPDFLRAQAAARTMKPPVTEAESLLEQLRSPRYHGPRDHWKKALEFALGERRDLANAAKEAVCAVEGLARIVTGQPKNTLGELIKHLRATERLNPAMAKTLEGIWGFASDSPGVRHGAASATEIKETETKFVMETCAAAIRYLLEIDR